MMPEKFPNQFLNWRPILKRRQHLILNDTKKLIQVIDAEIDSMESDVELKNNPEKEEEAEESPGDNEKIQKNGKSDTELEKEPYQQVQIDEENLTKGQIKEVKELLKRKAKVFAAKDSAPSKANNISHSIDTGDHPPINVPKYSVSHKDRPFIESHVKEMLKNKVIEPSKSPWAFPIVLVPKKDGTIRFCVDYRKLNAITVKDSYALPRIDDALATLSGNKFFTSLDLAQGYYQIPMSDKDKEKTAFITDSGL